MVFWLVASLRTSLIGSTLILLCFNIKIYFFNQIISLFFFFFVGSKGEG